MSKKIKDENGNVYIKKKPFYKRIWFWILVVIVIIFAGSQMGKGSSDNTKSSSSSSSSASSSSKSTTGLTKANFDKITLSDSTGTSEKDVKAMFKKTPSSTDTQTINNVSANMYTWSGIDGGDIASAIVVGFENGHAISKDITGIKVTRSSKITLAQFNEIQNGASKTDIQKQFGDPNGYDLTNIGGQSSEMWSYTSGVNGDVGANFNITFTNGVVSGKTQVSMK
ncbi:DUF3862 domain-containing protein [Lactobacillus sp. UCMA15818]|uniref:DUF3862 domain-containing protein n=1 Tax=Lactobacillus sp. UCMA15818 TaxID=2583394 RepID=UPI0025AF2E61|nr:DUF3862 domain-containing protein [Lactobacillus sp. UCMA15818]MDN2452562.1 DUF3862 domain-containing protein [Lactobacillus sp. UCMA15818]